MISQLDFPSFPALSPADLTLGDLDNTQDFKPLELAISRTATCYCQGIEQYDDTTHAGQRVLIYNVDTQVYNGEFDADEDGYYRDYDKHTERIMVAVHPEMTVAQIAAALTEQIRYIPGNKFA